jgi:hypothetical protein
VRRNRQLFAHLCELLIDIHGLQQHNIPAWDRGR